mgnify:FL=1
MTNKVFLTAEDIARELDVSKPFAYKIIRELNIELKEKGYITISGKLSRKYFEERFYGLTKEA